VSRASGFIFVCAVWSQALPDWIGAHVRAFGYCGDVVRQLVSNNLKAGVTRACFHVPEVNRTYTAMAAHYGQLFRLGGNQCHASNHGAWHSRK